MADRRAEDMHGRIVDAPIVVRSAIDQRRVVLHPDEVRQRAGDLVGQQFARFQVLDPRGKAFGAVGIGRIGEIAAVLRNRKRAQAEIFDPFGQRVLVEDQDVVAPGNRLAVIFAVFRAFLELRPVEIIPAALRHGGIVFLDARLHLREQFVDQRLLRLHPRFEPRVFGLQMVEHVLVVDRRIGLVAQPVIGVGNRDPVVRIAVVAFFGSRRRSRLWHCGPFGVLGVERRAERQRCGR